MTDLADWREGPYIQENGEMGYYAGFRTNAEYFNPSSIRVRRVYDNKFIGH